MKIRISGSAEEDLLAGFRFYEMQQRGLGSYFLDSLYADIDALSVFAGIHPKPIPDFHRGLAKTFPFAIYYQVVDDEAIVVAVLDCRQNPASIRKRLESPGPDAAT